MARKKSVERESTKLIDNEQDIGSNSWDLDFKINRDYDLNKLQLDFFKSIQDDKTNMCFVDGPAGTAKTYIAVLGAITLLNMRKIDSIVYLRSIVESASRSMGALPGEIEDKFAPWSMPLIDKLEEVVSISTSKLLMSKGYIKCIPVNYTRGLTFKNSLIIVDEAQNMTTQELTTILTRFGKGSKYVIVGDTYQADIGKSSGFKRIFDAFNCNESTENGVYTYKFTKNEIVRSEILKYIVSRLEVVK